LANDVNDETPWQKIKRWKATLPVELPLYCAVTVLSLYCAPVLLGLYTLAYIDCTCFKI